MLEVADNFSKAYDIKFNKTKSELLIYSNKSLKDIEVQILHGDAIIRAKKCTKHVGRVVGHIVCCRQPLRPVYVILHPIQLFRPLWHWADKPFGAHCSTGLRYTVVPLFFFGCTGSNPSQVAF